MTLVERVDRLELEWIQQKREQLLQGRNVGAGGRHQGILLARLRPLRALPLPLAADPLDPLRRSLGRLPNARRRLLRAFQPTAAGGLRPEGAGAIPLLNLASNDYLGLSSHPRLQEAACAAIASGGVGAGASRLVCGSRPVHSELETRLAAWLGRERVLLFPSGFQANIAAVAALADRHSLVLADRLIHHSLLVGVQASGAQLRRFPHNDLAALDRLLGEARASSAERRLVVLSESLFSMEGSSPDLPALSALCQQHSALLLIDEAHALGVLGPGGRGLAHGLEGVHLVSGTFGKAFGSGGAFLATGDLLGDWLLQRSGAFRYSTALAPPLAAAALAALDLLEETPDLGSKLLERAERWRTSLAAADWPLVAGQGPILPLLVGEDDRALDLQRHLETEGLLSVAIRPPTVPAGTARLRLVLCRDLPPGTLEQLLEALARWR
ncbi:aminotransferase class I/II-fold pyridoxal phosphate-dependent enzyme [Cyanobium sp. Morenito 9A2]|nr:aminotransferase class I/II-fold pyridoxal phosphate-dependent enzyme [Cyanobium sp. Morenito 9A2]